MENPLPAIPPKRYFTIGEVSELCQVKPYVLRYWEQEFTQLKPMKRRGNRRYYQHHEVLLIRRIRSLLYEQGFTISGARNRLGDLSAGRLAGEEEAGWDDRQAQDGHDAESLPEASEASSAATADDGTTAVDNSEHGPAAQPSPPIQTTVWAVPPAIMTAEALRSELETLRRLLDA